MKFYNVLCNVIYPRPVTECSKVFDSSVNHKLSRTRSAHWFKGALIDAISNSGDSEVYLVVEWLLHNIGFSIKKKSAWDGHRKNNLKKDIILENWRIFYWVWCCNVLPA